MLIRMAYRGAALSLDGVIIHSLQYATFSSRLRPWGIKILLQEDGTLLKKFIIILSILMLLSACGTGNQGAIQNRQQLPDVLTPIDPRIVEANNAFGLKLFQQLSQNKDVNVFISPVSISMAIAMAYQGAKGATQEEITKALEWNKAGLTSEEIGPKYATLLQSLTKADQGISVNIANALWAREGEMFHQSFLDTTQHFFEAKIQELDFNDPKAVPTINRWVKDKTKGKIDKIIEGPINSETMMFLMNAIYFKGDWSREFEEANTKKRNFTRSDRSTVPVQMMMQSGKYEYWDDSGFQAIRLPYGNGEMSMLIVLPDADNSLDSLIHQIVQEPTVWQQSFSQRTGEIQLPRFTVEYESSLNEALESLGMQLAFDPREADFSNMTERDVFISEVKHKSIIEVNEKGSEAAAVTSIEVTTTSAIVEVAPFKMIVDRPFFFVIEDRDTGSWLFIGAVNDPK